MQCECCGRETEVLIEIGAVSPKVSTTGRCCVDCCAFILRALEDMREELPARQAEIIPVYVETFGTEHQDRAFLEKFVRENYDLTPKGIIRTLDLLNVDYNRVSAYGHFGKAGLPWEK